MFFSRLGWGYGFGEGRPQRWSTLLITSYQTYISSRWRITNDVDLDHLADVVLARFPHKASSFSPFFPYSCSWEEVIVNCPHFRSGELCSLPWGRSIYIHYLQSLPILYDLLIYSTFIYISTTSWMFILYFRLKSNTILFILSLKFFQFWPLGTLSAGSCVPLHTSIIIHFLQMKKLKSREDE